MKGALLTLASVGSVAAQVTLPPSFNQKVGLSPDDAGYQTCTQIDGILSECIASVGGTNAFATADPDVVIGCLCCASSTSLAPYWSACSEYISEEFPRSSTMYDAYGTVYMGCSMSASCGGGSGGGGSGSSATADSDSSATTTDSEESTITSGSSSAATDSAGCDDMLSLYSSCAAETDNFNRQPFRSQAACYCCRGRGNSMTWTDELDQYAQTCADWAEEESPETYSVAATFTSFCEHFSDVCAEATATATEDDAESTSTDEAEETDEDSTANATGSEETNSSNPTDPVTVTRTDGPEPTETGAAANVRVGVVAALVFGAVVMVL